MKEGSLLYPHNHAHASGNDKIPEPFRKAIKIFFYRFRFICSVYITWMYLVVMYIVPFTCLALFNLRIYIQIRRANMERAKLSRLQQREIGMATMLICVVMVFFACNVLALVVNVLEVSRLHFIITTIVIFRTGNKKFSTSKTPSVGLGNAVAVLSKKQGVSHPFMHYIRNNFVRTYILLWSALHLS